MAALIAASLALGVAGAAAFRDEKGRDPDRFERELGMRRRDAEAAAREGRDSRAGRLRALRLDEREADCVAFDPARSACLVTVAEFNRRAEDWPPLAAAMGPDSLPADQARALRRDILGSLLAEPYLEYRLAAEPARDSLESAWRDLQAKRSAAEGPGDSALRALYKARFDSDFRGGEEPILQVLAMSDSGLADSLAAAFMRSGKTDTAPSLHPGIAIASPAAAALDAWHWRAPDTSDLPADLRRLGAGLARGETAGPFKIPYGRIFLRWVAMRHRPTVAFADAVPALSVLAQASRGGASPSDSAVSAYYREHRRDLTAPDSILLGVRLAPTRSAEAGLGAGVRNAELALDDAELPPSLRGRLGRFLEGKLGDTLGPVQSAFGTWHLRIAGPARAGRRLGFAEARPLILDRLARDHGNASSTAGMHARRDRATWALMAGEYLEERQGSGGAPARPVRSLAADRAEWMRACLAIRFIDPG